MSTVKEFKPYLVDGGDRANCVCGKCGTPLAEENAKTETDLTFVQYEADGRKRALYGLALVALPTLVFSVLFPFLIKNITSLLVDQPLYLKGGLITGSFFVGLGLLGTVRYRTDDFGLFTADHGERTVCEDCASSTSTQSLVRGATMLVGVVIALYGLYRCFTLLSFSYLKWVGLGTGIYLLSEEVTTFAATLLE